MDKEIYVGAIDQTIDVFIQDATATDGSGLDGLVFNSSGLTCYYRIGATGSATVLNLVTLATIGTAHADGGFKEVDATNMPGEYRLDLSDAMCATEGLLKIYLQGAADMAPTVVEIPIKNAFTKQEKVYVDATNGTNQSGGIYGTPSKPTTTVANAKTIADNNNLTKIHIVNGATLASAMEGYSFYAPGRYDTGDIIDVNGQSIERSTFESLVITGSNGGGASINDQVRYNDCYLYAHTNINGAALECAVDGACSIRDGGNVWFRGNHFGLALACTLTVQAPTDAKIENPAGTLALAGMDGGTLNIFSCQNFNLTINNTCTAGTINIYGPVNLTDNSGVGCTVNLYPSQNDLVDDAVDSDSVATSGANEIRDSILNDATRFSGENIDASISTRAAESTVAKDATVAKESTLNAVGVIVGGINSKIGTPPNLGTGANVGSNFSDIAGIGFVTGNDSLKEISDSSSSLTEQQIRDSMQLNPTTISVSNNYSIDKLIRESRSGGVGSLVITPQGVDTDNDLMQFLDVDDSSILSSWSVPRVAPYGRTRL